MRFQILLILFVTFLNFWVWRIFQFNIFVGFLAVINSILLFHLFLSQSYKRKAFVLLFFFTVVQAVLIRTDINFKLEDTKPEEILQLHAREFYYAQDLGRLFLNKISLNYYYNADLFLYKLQRNFFYNLDPNLYFFASHPRERGPYEFDKYSSFFLPFFIFGLLWLIMKDRDLSLGYIFLILIISIFIDPAFRLGPLFLFPLINSLIAVGLLKVIRR